MPLDFETVGKYVGGLIGGVGNGVVQGVKGAVVGGGAGAVVGAGVGAVVGAPTGPGEVITIPSGATAGLATGAVVGGAYGAVDGVTTGVPAGMDVGSSAGHWLDQKIAELRGADNAADNADAKAKAITCATCEQNPCAKYACGVPGSKYRGGAHGCMTGTPETKGDELDSHHMPAKSKSPLNPNVSPAIQMRPADHAKTASYGGKVNGIDYAPQRALLAEGQTMAAIMLDARDVKDIAVAAGDPTRYDAAIIQMLAYARCLQANGIIR